VRRVLARVLGVVSSSSIASGGGWPNQWRIYARTVRESSMDPDDHARGGGVLHMLSLLYVTQSAAQWLVDLEDEPLGADAGDQTFSLWWPAASCRPVASS